MDDRWKVNRAFADNEPSYYTVGDGRFGGARVANLSNEKTAQQFADLLNALEHLTNHSTYLINLASMNAPLIQHDWRELRRFDTRAREGLNAIIGEQQNGNFSACDLRMKKPRQRQSLSQLHTR